MANQYLNSLPRLIDVGYDRLSKETIKVFFFFFNRIIYILNVPYLSSEKYYL